MVDPTIEVHAVREANILGIPIVAICDTNCDPDLIDYPIPGNDDAIKATRLITSRIADAVIEGREGLQTAEAPAVEEAETSLPTRFAVKDPYPNPFSELGTTVRFRLPWSAHIAVKIYDERGRFVRDLVNDELGPGEFTFTWDGTDARGAKVASGTYIFRIEAPGLRMHKKVTFLR